MMRHLALSVLPLTFLSPVMVMAQTLEPFERSEVQLVRVAEGLGIQLNLRNKPVTRYANVIYQLLVQRDGAWVPVYSNTGARLLPGGGGSLNPPMEVIPLSELEAKLGRRLEQLGNGELQAVVTIRYDLSSDRRDLVWNGTTTQGLGQVLGTPPSETLPAAVSPRNDPPRSGQFGLEPTDAELGITRSPQTTREPRSSLPAPALDDAPPGVELSPARPHRGHFNLGVFTVGRRQPLLARLSLRSLRANGFLAERYVGDYLFDSSQRATFVRGLNPGDRMVVRFFDAQGRQLVGYSEFELLDDFAAVNLVVNPLIGSVRTVMGENRDRSGIIDRGAAVWDYWTQLEGAPSSDLERVTARFLDQAPDLELGSFAITGLPRPERRSVLPRSFTSDSFVLTGRPITVLRRDLEPPLLALPNQTIPIIRVGGGVPTYEVISQILRFRNLTLDNAIRLLP